MARATRARSAAGKGKSAKDKAGSLKPASRAADEKKGKVTSLSAAAKERKPAASEPRIAGRVARLRQFFRDVRGEVKKVMWPSRKQLFASTMAVLVAILILAIYIGLLDFAFRGIANSLNL